MQIFCLSLQTFHTMNCSDLFATGIRRINILKYNNISETIPETDNPLRKLILELSSFRTTL